MKIVLCASCYIISRPKTHPFPYNRHHLSYGGCLGDKIKGYQTVLCHIVGIEVVNFTGNHIDYSSHKVNENILSCAAIYVLLVYNI